MAFIIAAYFLWDKQYARAAAQRAKQRGAPGVVQRLLQLAAPRLYAVVATYLPLTWTLWQDVAVYALVRVVARSPSAVYPCDIACLHTLVLPHSV